MKDIARIAGVSIGTVDRALHNRGRVSPETADRIRRIAEEAAFIPDPHASHLSTARKYSFAVIMPGTDQDGGFWKLPSDGIRKAAGELAPLRITIDSYHFDRTSERSFIERSAEVLSHAPDGIVIAPVLPEAAREFLKILPDTVPFVLIDTDIPGVRPLSFIGQDSYRSGKLAARLMKLLTGSSTDIRVISTVRPDYHITARIAGFYDSYVRYSLPEPVVEEKFEEPSVSERLMDELLSSDPEIKGIFITNASVHIAAEYLEKRFPNGAPVRLMGYDLTRRNKRFLESGFIDFLISQRPELQAYEAVNVLYRHLVLRQDSSARITMPLDILTAENVEHYR